MSAETILRLYLALLAAQFAAEQGLTLANMGHLRRLRARPPRQALGLMELKDYQRSLDYTRDRSRLSLVSVSVHTAVLLLLVLSGWLGGLEGIVTTFARPLGSGLSSVAFVYSCAAAFALISLPFSLYSQFVIEARYGFNRMSWRLWVIDTLKALGVSLVLMTPLLYGLFRLVQATPLWWLWAFGGFTALQVVMVYVYPKLIAPLFNRYTPLEEGSLRQRVFAMADRLGVPTRGIYVVDGSRRSSHSNAYFSGFGRARRIVLFDTLTRTLSEGQIAAVLAHEVGHQKLRHVVTRIVLSLLAVGLGLWVASRLLGFPPLFSSFGFAAPSAAAAVVMVLYFGGPLALLPRPLTSWWSRHQEFRADRYARDVAGEGENLAAALVALSRDNLSNPTPHPWYSFVYYSHPPVLERLRALGSRAVEGSTPPGDQERLGPR